jgi:hypothetical protein
MRFKFFLITTTILLVFSPFLVKAYPNNAKTIPFSIIGTNTTTLLEATDTPRTILNVTILNYAYNVSQSSWVTCGLVKLAEGYYKEGRDSRDMVYLCKEKIEAHNVGSVNSNGQIVYVDYDLNLNSSIEQINATNSTSTFWLSKTWDYGELFIAFLMVLQLFLIIFLIVFSFFFEPVIKVRGKK